MKAQATINSGAASVHPDIAAVAGATPAPQLLMSPPDFFEVSYAINPWMDPAQWALDAKQLAQEARSGWAALKARYEALGAQIVIQPAVRGLPDLVFTANCAVVLDGKTFAPELMLVALGIAQALLNFILKIHMISMPMTVGPFSLTKAIALIIVTFVVGYIFGWLVAFFWNKNTK